MFVNVKFVCKYIVSLDLVIKLTSEWLCLSCIQKYNMHNVYIQYVAIIVSYTKHHQSDFADMRGKKDEKMKKKIDKKMPTDRS